MDCGSEKREQNGSNKVLERTLFFSLCLGHGK